MNRAFVTGFAALISASLPASAAILDAAVTRFPAAPAAVLGAAAAPALVSANLSAPLASLPAVLAAAPALAPALIAAPFASLPPPSLSAALAPAAVLALPALRAAADAPSAFGEPGAPGNSEAASPKAPEDDAAAAGGRFDGKAPKPEPVAVPAAPSARAAKPAPAPLGAGLKVADPADEAWLARVVKSLSRSKTGRRVLRDIAALAQKRGSPTLIVVKPISNNGEFRYDSDLLVMDAAHRKRAPEQTAPILAHELQHVLQRALELPVDALELEVESYTVENRVWSELHVEPDARTFARQARARLLKDPDQFLVWLGEQYDGNRLLHGGSVESYVAWLNEKTPGLARRTARAEKNLAAARRVVDKMRAEGKPEDAVRAFIQEDVEPVERRLRDLAVERAWVERDLGLLADPAGRKRFRDYSRGVIRRARSLSAASLPKP